jgi:hypothetical protein
MSGEEIFSLADLVVVKLETETRQAEHKNVFKTTKNLLCGRDAFD